MHVDANLLARRPIQLRRECRWRDAAVSGMSSEYRGPMAQPAGNNYQETQIAEPQNCRATDDVLARARGNGALLLALHRTQSGALLIGRRVRRAHCGATAARCATCHPAPACVAVRSR